MNKAVSILIICFFLGNGSLFAQEELGDVLIANDTIPSVVIDPLTPAKASFYSAVLPGLGQIYNKQYWKVPIVYIGIGAGIYFYSTNNQEYNRYRDAYKRRLAGFRDDEFAALDDARLIDAQKFYQRNRNLSILVTAGLYILNIVDANVSAHLRQFNVDERLTLRPEIYQNPIDYKHNIGLTLSYNF
ncbi:DUF5683 domain-containing protein [Flavobacterium sp. '19STA2R22 D10 B1']|uniref:DUF5683 domain-containing protein n=1 Tax=Flavobacterium aerium TaxID=3037261 RepID=UPI00278BD03D|nr:DUF5683 domain-containing protein [Flavobacterium sp. '19STA2R22 D10 B1']